MPLKVEYGIPRPTERIEGNPEFKSKGTTLLKLRDFPFNVLPSGGMSNKISPSEMYMVKTCRPTNMIWKDELGKTLLRASNVQYSFIGRFQGEITNPGIYRCCVEYKGTEKGYVEFEVI